MRIVGKNFNLTNGSFFLVIESEENGRKNQTPYAIDVNHPKYDLLKEAFVKDDAEKFIDYLQAKSKEQVLVKKYVDGSGIVVGTNGITYNGEEVKLTYVRRILDMKNAKLPIDPMIKFLENLLKNPSNRSREELPDFMENKNLPITEDGCFLAYKAVRPNYWSKASGSLKLTSGETDAGGHINNSVGQSIRCERGEVDDERGNECSHGLHVGGLAYSGPGGFYHNEGDKVVIVKVNPADVVSVPKDHNAQKVRVAAYEVIGEYVQALPNEVARNDNYNQSIDEDDEWEDWDDDEEEDDYEADEIEEGDLVSFDYQSKAGGPIERRYVGVENVDYGHIEGYVLKQDPSYDIGEEFRRFMTSKITNVTYNNV